MFIDESGNHDLRGSSKPNNRYLSLTGLIFKEGPAQQRLESEILRLKVVHFGHTDAQPVILHREDIVKRLAPFECLHEEAARGAFDSDCLRVIDGLPYVALTVTIDKVGHLALYKVWQKDPYHYCLEVLIERYVMFLEERGAVGDIVIEARNKKLDKKVKRLYHFFYRNGSQFKSALAIQARMTSKEIKIKPKSANVAGLQLCDLLAHPARVAALAQHKGETMEARMGARIADILEDKKYRCSPYGTVDGWGRKWLP
jgi:hypothetical protein